MSPRRRVIPIVLLVLLTATGVGLVLTSRPLVTPRSRAPRRTEPFYRTITESQNQFDTARKLAGSAWAREEKWMAREALRIADSQVDLAFAAALQEAAAHPPSLSPEAQAISDRVKSAQAQVDFDQAEIERLKKRLAGAKASAKDALQQQLQLVEAQGDLDQDQLDEARRDLIRAGGDPQAIIGRMKQRYEAQEQAAGGLQNLVPSGPQNSPEETQSQNVVALAGAWYSLHEKIGQLRQAQDEVQAQLAALKEASGKPAQEEARRTAQAPPPPREGTRAAPSSGASLAARAKPSAPEPSSLRRSAAQRKSLDVIDKRVEDETQLADTYTRWSTFVKERQRQSVHGLLYCLLWILVIALVTVLIDIWVSGSLAKVTADRRQVHTLHSVARYVIRGVGFILILLVIFGPPSQFAAVLALAGAGLTVALKDFVVAFIGWFVLMGRHGIRVGDWVEINGVSGDVVEIGPLRTILLETGDLSEAGQPTGRKVAFMNGFAVEGNYFNFSTSGQWMWDEMQLPVPAESDPFAMAEDAKRLVAAQTSENAQLAAEEWRKVAPRTAPQAFRGEPVISVRPTGAGATLAIRYITRAHERQEVRSRIYRALHDLQRGDGASQAEPGSEPR